MGAHGLSGHCERSKMLAQSVAPLASMVTAIDLDTYTCSGQGNCALQIITPENFKFGVFDWSLNEPCQHINHILQFEKVLGCLTGGEHQTWELDTSYDIIIIPW